jgi:hypothetical protein
MDLPRITWDSLFYFAMQLLKNGHEGFKVDSFQNTDVPHSGFVHPDPVIGGFPDKNIPLVHVIPWLFLQDSISHLTSSAKDRLPAATASSHSYTYSRRNISSIFSISFSISCMRCSMFPSSLCAWYLFVRCQLTSIKASERANLSRLILIRWYSGFLSFSFAWFS